MGDSLSKPECETLPIVIAITNAVPWFAFANVPLPPFPPSLPLSAPLGPYHGPCDMKVPSLP